MSLKSYLEVHYTICEASSLFSRQLKHGDMEDMTKSSRQNDSCTAIQTCKSDKYFNPWLLKGPVILLTLMTGFRSSSGKFRYTLN